MVKSSATLRKISYIAIFCALVSVGISAFMLSQWLSGDPERMAFATHTMKFNTALAVLFAGIAMIYAQIRGESRWLRAFQTALASVPTLFGLLTLLQYMFGWTLGIDQIFVDEMINPESAAFPGRMAPNAALCLTLVGLSIIFLGLKEKWIKEAQRIAFGAGVIGFLALIGYIFERPELYQLSTFIRMSPYTAFCVLLISVSVLLTCPTVGITQVLLARTVSGAFSRNLLGAIFIGTPILSWLGSRIFKAQWLDEPTAVALIFTSIIFMLLAVIWQSAQSFVHSELALQESERKFKTLANSVPQMLWIADAKGHITWFNQRWLDFTGKSFDEVGGARWHSVHHPNYVTDVDRKYFQCIAAGVPWEDTFPLRGCDGKYRWFLSRAIPIRNHLGEITSWFGSNTDVTEKLEAERELKKNKLIAERANAAKSRFLANMSHEIRTPIGAIMGFTELLKENIVSSPEERSHYMSVVERNSQNLLRLIDDILDFSKIESGHVDIRNEFFSLDDFLSSLASTMRLKAQEKDIDFQLIQSPSLPDYIFTDQLRLHQILSNVLNNAVKFTSVGCVKLQVSYDRPMLEFSVLDTGPGIRPAHREKLFKSFSQVDTSLRRRFGGTGLGLVLSKKLAQVLGGDLTLESSEPGVGSEFKIRIPVEVSNELVVPLRPRLNVVSGRTDRPLKGQKILAVDDSPDNRDLMCIFLKQAGAEVVAAVDGEDALTKVSAFDPDLILMDIQMPNLDGHQTTRKLRSLGYKRPIIALSAHAMKTERDRAFESGFSDYFAKPIRRIRLIESIEQHLAPC